MFKLKIEEREDSILPLVKPKKSQPFKAKIDVSVIKDEQKLNPKMKSKLISAFKNPPVKKILGELAKQTKNGELCGVCAMGLIGLTCGVPAKDLINHQNFEDLSKENQKKFPKVFRENGRLRSEIMEANDDKKASFEHMAKIIENYL